MCCVLWRRQSPSQVSACRSRHRSTRDPNREACRTGAGEGATLWVGCAGSSPQQGQELDGQGLHGCRKGDPLPSYLCLHARLRQDSSESGAGLRWGICSAAGLTQSALVSFSLTPVHMGYTWQTHGRP